jgi:hypothetical protein
MKRFALVAGTLFALTAAGPAAAQFPGPSPFQQQYRPTLNPALLLNRNSRAADWNFFAQPYFTGQPPAAATGVPDLGAQRRPGFDEPEDFIPTLPQTGHTVRFLNYGPYFNIGTAPRAGALNPNRYPRPR